MVIVLVLVHGGLPTLGRELNQPHATPMPVPSFSQQNSLVGIFDMTLPAIASKVLKVARGAVGWELASCTG